MKSFIVVVAALSALCGVEAASNSTVVCSSCPEATSTNDIVTREPIPTTSCTAPALTVIPDMTTSTVYTTSVYTITSCPPTVTDCPVGSVTTETKSLYTTVCPVSPPAPTGTNAVTMTTSAGGPGSGGPGASNPVMPTPTGLPVGAAGLNVAGSVSGLMALAVAAAYLV